MAQQALTPRQTAFVTAIKAGRSQTQAYVDAGYSPNGANGHAARLIATGSVQRALREHQQRELARADYDADRYWKQFVRSVSPAERRPESYLEFFYYGVEPRDGRPVGELVLSGTKTAAGDILWRREATNLPRLQAGSFSIFHDGYGDPMGIIETTEVKIVPFNEVDADFAYDCGEWGRTLENWRKWYWSWIEAECAKLGRDPSPQTPMICERYRLVYSEPLRGDD